MPKLYRRKTRKGKRIRRRYRRKNAGITRQVQTAFSDRQIVKLNYFDQIVMDPGTLQAASYAFRANDIFDPDYSSVGHQPMGFDQWAGFYNRWVVLGAKITVTPISSDSTTNQTSGVLTVSLQRSPISDLNINQQMEQKHCRYSTFQLGYRSRPVTVFYSAKKFEGVKDVSDNDDLFGTLAASPSKQSYFVLSAYAPQASTEVLPIRMQVKVQYIVMFKDPQRLGIS